MKSIIKAHDSSKGTKPLSCQTQNPLQTHTQKNCKCCAISSDVCLEGRSWQQEAEMASSYVALFKAKNVINEQNLAGTYYTDKFHLKVILTFLVEKSA